MYYSKKRQFLFCHVPRTGGTSISQHLKDNVEGIECLLKLQHLSMVKAKITLGPVFDHLFKFAFVRNPWERMVSWYGLEALANQNFDKGVEPDYEPDSSHWRKFDDFIEGACTKKVPTVVGYGLAYSQWHQLADQDGKLLVDYIGRYENYMEDAMNLMQKIGVLNEPIEKLNASSHIHYSEYYSDLGRQMVAEVFHKDIYEFGYQFETGI